MFVAGVSFEVQAAPTVHGEETKPYFKFMIFVREDEISPSASYLLKNEITLRHLIVVTQAV